MKKIHVSKLILDTPPTLSARGERVLKSKQVDPEPIEASAFETFESFDINEIDSEGGDSTVNDLTGKFKKQPAGIVKMYKQPAEYALAMYAVTQLVNSFGKLVRNSRSIHGDPTTTSINTDVKNTTTVYCDMCATLEFPRGNGNPPIEGIIQTIMLDEGFRVSMASSKREGVALLEKAYNKMLEQHNFYQGKTLRFGRELVEFIPVPNTRLQDVIMSDEIAAEYNLNVVQFLTNLKMQAITKKRGMLLYGPPGTGTGDV